jgi:hypothetical protein
MPKSKTASWSGAIKGTSLLFDRESRIVLGKARPDTPEKRARQEAKARNAGYTIVPLTGGRVRTEREGSHVRVTVTVIPAEPQPGAVVMVRYTKAGREVACCPPDPPPPPGEYDAWTLGRGETLGEARVDALEWQQWSAQQRAAREKKPSRRKPGARGNAAPRAWGSLKRLQLLAQAEEKVVPVLDHGYSLVGPGTASVWLGASMTAAERVLWARRRGTKPATDATETRA